jgi:fatty acid desaturase/peptidoglycan/LPS O-acetylase OafA/YrhL
MSLSQERILTADRRSLWPWLAIKVHLLVVIVAGWQLAGVHSRPILGLWATVSGVSLFVLTGLVHEASHRLLARPVWFNELAGNLAGWMVLTPLTAYRAFHLKHHQTTNREDDPNAPLNSRWMLGFGSIVYVILIHWHALKNLRGKLRARYLREVVGMAAFLAALVLLLPRAVRERSWLLPMGIVLLLQNIRIVTEHLDLPAGRYRDTWQLVLPGWLSRWLLHYDHHLEHHLRPGLHWHELPGYRAALVAREPGLGLRCVRLGQFFREVFPRFRTASGGQSLGRPSPSVVALGPSPSPDGSRSDLVVNDPAKRGPASHSRLRADAPAISSGPAGSSKPRYNGLDALRAATMLLVVGLHAALAYARVPIPNLIWAVRDPAAHSAFDLICWWTLGISSPFFLMSGFFAAELYVSRGPRAYLVNRVKRIVGPLLAAGLTILPATFFVWVGGWLISGQCTPREFLRLKFHAQGFQHNLYGPAHLWSLEYLALLLLAFWIVLEFRRLLPWRWAGPSQWVDRMSQGLASPWRPFLLAVPTTLILWAGHNHVGLDAIMDRQNSFLPESCRLLHNAVFFVVGVILHRSRHILSRLATYPWTYLALSVPVFAARAYLIQRDLESSLVGPAALALAASGALFTWLVTFGFLGLALGASDHPRPVIRYLSDSSYWVYLCHLPMVGLLQVDLFLVQAPAVLKFLVVLTVTMSLGLASYQVLVRYSLLGTWLHGRRDRPRPISPPKPRIFARLAAEPLSTKRLPGTPGATR